MMDSDKEYTASSLKQLELRQAVDNHRAVMNARLVDLWTELRAITACLRDISDVMHAQYYGDKTAEEEVPSDDDGSEAGT